MEFVNGQFVKFIYQGHHIDGRVSVDEGIMYFVQDMIDGNPTANKMGYNKSWEIGAVYNEEVSQLKTPKLYDKYFATGDVLSLDGDLYMVLATICKLAAISFAGEYNRFLAWKTQRDLLESGFVIAGHHEFNLPPPHVVYDIEE